MERAKDSLANRRIEEKPHGQEGHNTREHSVHDFSRMVVGGVLVRNPDDFSTLALKESSKIKKRVRASQHA